MPNTSAEFECDPAAAAAARAFVEAALQVWDLDDLAEVAVLLTSELVTNVILHARTSLRVEISHEAPEVVVAVHDRSSRLPLVPGLDTLAEGGRGLRLVGALAARWGVQPTSEGKAVWFALRAAA